MAKQKGRNRYGFSQRGRIRPERNRHLQTLKEASQPAEYDEEIMAALLEEPGVKKEAARMNPQDLEKYKNLLVHQGVYERFATLYRLGWLSPGTDGEQKG